ncbi:hypothetical protein [Psittacicella melopsittaci]|uniref:hypothetical protein n=1 Tax=Psittacicella melopsittaci TaxID=2028576 RepID=UPI001CA75613|nr:hypothetical protein [Psittacicella melopsittaci]
MFTTFVEAMTKFGKNILGAFGACNMPFDVHAAATPSTFKCHQAFDQSQLDKIYDTIEE